MEQDIMGINPLLQMFLNPEAGVASGGIFGGAPSQGTFGGGGMEQIMPLLMEVFRRFNATGGGQRVGFGGNPPQGPIPIDPSQGVTPPHIIQPISASNPKPIPIDRMPATKYDPGMDISKIMAGIMGKAGGPGGVGAGPFGSVLGSASSSSGGRSLSGRVSSL